MIKLKNLLLESPNFVKIPRDNGTYKKISWFNSDAITFSIRNNAAYIGVVSKSHYITHGMLPKYYKSLNWPKNGKIIDGRLWYKHKIISFWGKYPSRQKLEKILYLIHKEFKSIIDNKSENTDFIDHKEAYINAYDKIKNLNINNEDWRIELPPDDIESFGLNWSDDDDEKSIFVKLSDYQNLNKNSFKQVDHVKPPSAKAPKEFKGYGSHKTYAGMTPTQYHQMVSTSENKK